MALIPCKTAVDCPCDDNPVLGLNAEAADVPTYIGVGYGPSEPPPLNSTWKNAHALSLLDVPVNQPGDQMTANLLAESQSVQTAAAGWELNGEPVTAYQNNPQSFSEMCPDGSVFTFGVIAGMFSALNQAQADQAALSYCQRQIQLHMTCLSDVVPNTVESHQPYYGVITASGLPLKGIQENVWALTSGALPPGLVFNGGALSSNMATITGTPTTAGTFAFTVMVSTPQGDYMERAYSIGVSGVVGGPPVGNQFQPYYYQISVAGFTGPATFAVDPSSSLPQGLTMSTSGLITGTPTSYGPYASVVDITVNGVTVLADLNFTIEQWPVYTVTPDPQSGLTSYFNNGAAMPGGLYQVSYVNGALFRGANWIFNAMLSLDNRYYYLIDNVYPPSGLVFPGTTNTFTSQAAVEAANAGQQITYKHAGGTIGMVSMWSGHVYSPGTVAPTFALTRLA